MVNEVRVTQLVPGSHLAQLISLGAVYLPRGGSEAVDLSGQFSSPPALIGDLGADAGAQLAVGAPVEETASSGGTGGGEGGGAVGGAGQHVNLTVYGTGNSLGAGAPAVRPG